jgi:hypothetical protein
MPAVFDVTLRVAAGRSTVSIQKVLDRYRRVMR